MLKMCHSNCPLSWILYACTYVRVTSKTTFKSDTQFSGTSLMADQNPADILTVMLHSSSERESITAETSTGISSIFKLVPENCVSRMLQPAEKHHLHHSAPFTAFLLPHCAAPLSRSACELVITPCRSVLSCSVQAPLSTPTGHSQAPPSLLRLATHKPPPLYFDWPLTSPPLYFDWPLTSPPLYFNWPLTSPPLYLDWPLTSS